MAPTKPTRQADLPFGEAEGTKAERKNLLGIALMRVEANIYLAQLVLWIFNTTSVRPEPLKKSYAELAARPWGLCCHVNQVAATVKKARRLGLIQVTETWTGPGIQGANQYAIDWGGVRRILGSLPPHTTCDPPHTTCDPGHTTCGQTKEYTSSHLFSPSESDRQTEAADGLKSFDAEPRTVRRSAGWLQEVPELREAATRSVAALPPGDLAYGAFAPVAQTDLSDGSLVPWFRRQLGLSRPVIGATEAELLLVLAAGLAAAAVPAADVQRSRVAIFAATVKRGIWEQVLRRVPAARKLLDAICARWPEALSSPDGMGQELAAAASTGGLSLQPEGVCDGPTQA